MNRRHDHPGRAAPLYAGAHVAPSSSTLILKEAAARLGVTPDTLRQQRANGRLEAEKHGRDWWVTEAEVLRYEREQLGQPGRKPGKKGKR